MSAKRNKESNAAPGQPQDAALKPFPSGVGVRLYPPHFKTPVEVCGPCVNGEQVCMTTRFTWKCETISEGYESPLGIDVPPIVVCGWELEVVSIRTKKCTDRTIADKVFLPALA
jgi:hypothetical protein